MMLLQTIKEIERGRDNASSINELEEISIHLPNQPMGVKERAINIIQWRNKENFIR